MNEHIQDRLITILATKFNNGYRVSSNIEFERLRNFYVIEYGEEFLTDSSWLKSFCSSNALLYDDRAYFFDNDTVVVVISYITQVGSPCIFIDYLYERHITDFYGIRIFSVDMLRAFINKYCPDISINADYITLQDDISPADLVKAISKENDKWTIEELQERLPYLKVETIKQAKKSDEYLRVGTDTYVHIDNMDLPDAEGLRIISIIEMYLDKFDNVTLNEIDLSKFEELNPEFSLAKIRNAVFQKFLKKDYILMGQALTRKDAVLEISVDNAIDYSQIDYELIFKEVLAISPRLGVLIDFIRDIPPPQWGEWAVLLTQAQNGSQNALKRLIDMNLRAVLKIALNTHKNKGYELEDLFQEGVMGLMRSIDRFEAETSETNFGSYMSLWILQFMNRAYDDQSRTIRLPSHMVESVDKINRVSERLAITNGRDPTITELSNELFIPVEKVHYLLNVPSVVLSLDCTLDEIANDIDQHTAIEVQKLFGITDFIEEPIRNLILGEMSSETTSEATEKILKEQLAGALRTLSEREERVMQLRYGLIDGRERTLEEVGREFGVTRERIRQIEAKAIRKLRHPSRSKKLKDYLFT